MSVQHPVIFGIVLFCLIVSTLWAGPSNPNATPEAKALLQYLVSLTGQKMLSGQESMMFDGSFPSKRDQYVYKKTGKYPAIYTSDFVDGGIEDRPIVVSNCIAYHEKGSIIALQYHMVQPDIPDGSGFTAMAIKGSGYTKVPDILTPGHQLNTEFNRRLDELAGYLHALEDKRIAVLWRPFHEMNGDWFWWSYQERFKELWQYEWKYLTNVKKCNNLVWVFGVNWYHDAPPTSKQSPSYYYPGHEYVDVLGCDFYLSYGHSYDQRVHDELRALGGGKPIGIAENGTMPDIPELRKTQPYWVYWATWWGFEAPSSQSGNSDALYAKNYGDPSVITQDEVSIPPAAILPFVYSDGREHRFTREKPGVFAALNGAFFTKTKIGGETALFYLNGKKQCGAWVNRGIRVAAPGRNP